MKHRIFNRSDETEKRQVLRGEAPSAERLLWSRIRRDACGAKFRRQVSVGAFVLDFYCPTLRLALEIDGPTHENDEAVARDSTRQQYIEALGVRFLRFTNEQVYHHLPDVVETICGVVREMQEGVEGCNGSSEASE